MLGEYHVGQHLDALLSVRVTNNHENIYGVSVVIKSTRAKAIYLLSIIMTTMQPEKYLYIISHGFEILNNNYDAISSTFSNMLPFGAIDRFIALSSKDLKIYTFGNVSQMLMKEMLQVISSDLNCGLLENANIPFGVALGIFLHPSFRHQLPSHDILFSACTKRRFASEIVQLAAIALDNFALSDSFMEKLLNMCQVIIILF